jgi:hypothetical protein
MLRGRSSNVHGTINAPGGVADSVSVRGQRVILRTMSPFHGGTHRSRNECRAAILIRHHGPMTVIQAPAGLFVQRNADITPTRALCQERECHSKVRIPRAINLYRHWKQQPAIDAKSYWIPVR